MSTAPRAMRLNRRHALLAGAALLAGCEPPPPEVTGGFAGASFERGHRLRDPAALPAPAVSRFVDVVIAGGGIAGLAAARALRQRGIEDFVLLELEDAPGGNSRASQLAGIPCPLGAHYLPVPGDDALAQALARPLGERLRTGQLVTRIAEQRHGVEVDVFDFAGRRAERWIARRCIVALPVLVAARVLEAPPAALTGLAARTRYAPWIVANLHLAAPLEPPRDGGMPTAWDNVLYGADSLGYVVATHQRLEAQPGPTVLSWYGAPGEAARGELLRAPWGHWRDRVLAELSVPHRDLRAKLTQVQVARHGHAMAVPVPGALSALPPPPDTGRLRFAHGDWAGYSAFEEAFTIGHEAGGRRA